MTQTKQGLELIILSDEDDQPPAPDTNPWLAVVDLIAMTVEHPSRCRCGKALNQFQRCPDLDCGYRPLQ